MDEEARDGGIPCKQKWWNGIQKIIQDENLNGDGIIGEMCGIKLIRTGQVKKNG